METVRLYWKDAYQTQFDAKVLAVRADLNAVVLDQTLFFPEGGGQVADKGEINGVAVANVLKNRDDEKEIFHFVAPEAMGLFSVGQSVHGAIDWEKRFRTMRLHSASHLVFYSFRAMDPACVASSGKVDWEKDRSDYSFSEGVELTPEFLEKVTSDANRVISMSLPIKIWFADANDYEQNPLAGGKTDIPIGLRKKWQLQIPAGDFSLSGFGEIMDCGGTHVKNTSEIGKIVVKKGKSPGRGQKRVEIFLQE